MEEIQSPLTLFDVVIWRFFPSGKWWELDPSVWAGREFAIREMKVAWPDSVSSRQQEKFGEWKRVQNWISLFLWYARSWRRSSGIDPDWRGKCGWPKAALFERASCANVTFTTRKTGKNKLVPQQRLEPGFNKQVALKMGGRSGGFQLWSENSVC